MGSGPDNGLFFNYSHLIPKTYQRIVNKHVNNLLICFEKSVVRTWPHHFWPHHLANKKSY